MSRKVGVIDYGTGNLKSVVKAFEYLNADVSIIQGPEEMKGIDALVFPGQGTFDQCMQSLMKSGLDQALRSWINQGKPYFGICLGLQVLFETSEEGSLSGLRVFKGHVRRFTLKATLKIPHMGWNRVSWNLPPGDSLRNNLSDSDQFYFVHSYYLADVSEDLITFETTYGIPFVSGIFSGKCIATQFHPEKSQAKGLQLYRNFLEKIV
jgi:glutamine amidotransferase